MESLEQQKPTSSGVWKASGSLTQVLVLILGLIRNPALMRAISEGRLEEDLQLCLTDAAVLIGNLGCIFCSVQIRRF